MGVSAPPPMFSADHGLARASPWSPRHEGSAFAPHTISCVASTDRRETESGIEVKPVYAADDVAGVDLELPGEFPFTRGPYRDMYRGKPWTIRQYAGFASAEETNTRFRYLLERGQTGLSVAFDLPTEYIARGNYIFPPRPSMRITTDLFAYCAERLPRWNTISISGYHIREAGSTAAQELAFTLANGIAYCEAAVAAGLSPDAFGARLSFFFNAHNHVLQEVAKFRAARRLWATIMRDRFGATSQAAQALRFHAQTGGSTLTAQQPENNLVRVAAQALSAIYGGAQSIHTNGFDEALALPTERSATLALRTQQLLAHEAGGTDTADPFGGSYFIEALTTELEERAWELIERVDELGGAVEAIEQGFVQREIEDSAFRYQEAVERGEAVVVGVNRYEEHEAEPIELHTLDPEAERRQLERTANVRAERNAEDAAHALDEVRRVARSDENLLVVMRRALGARCTIGEICDVLREEYGTYDSQRP